MADRYPPSPRLTEQISRSFGLLWTRYAGRAPTAVRVSVRGDAVTCVLVDGVEAFEGRTDAAGGTRYPETTLTSAHYEVEAVEIITRLTRQRVASHVSTRNRETDVATEVFELETSPGNRPHPPRNFRYAGSATETAPSDGHVHDPRRH